MLRMTWRSYHATSPYTHSSAQPNAANTLASVGFRQVAKMCFGGCGSRTSCFTNSKPMPRLAPVINNDPMRRPLSIDMLPAVKPCNDSGACSVYGNQKLLQDISKISRPSIFKWKAKGQYWPLTCNTNHNKIFNMWTVSVKTNRQTDRQAEIYSKLG